MEPKLGKNNPAIQRELEEDARAHIRQCFRRYGIEATEQKIKELLPPLAAAFMLRLYRELLQ